MKFLYKIAKRLNIQKKNIQKNKKRIITKKLIQIKQNLY